MGIASYLEAKGLKAVTKYIEASGRGLEDALMMMRPRARTTNAVWNAVKHVQASAPPSAPLIGKLPRMDENLHIEVLSKQVNVRGLAEAIKEQIFGGNAAINHNKSMTKAENIVGRLSGRL